jgi:transcriptional regulator with XRE-family HTH domain
MYGRILRHLRESKGRSQAEVAKAVAISPAHLARLEAEQRGLYVKDFVNIAEALGEKPGMSNRSSTVSPPSRPSSSPRSPPSSPKSWCSPKA